MKLKRTKIIYASDDSGQKGKRTVTVFLRRFKSFTINKPTINMLHVARQESHDHFHYFIRRAYYYIMRVFTCVCMKSANKMRS